MHEILPGKTVINIPGCPPNVYNFLSTVLYLVTFGKPPDLDDKNRPKFAYGRLIHENCERRPHFDAGRFALEFGDAGHRQGWCLYKLGCKGPETYANCPAILFGDVGAGAWPVGTGHPCFGCTEQGRRLHQADPLLANVLTVTPPTAFPRVGEAEGRGHDAGRGGAGGRGGRCRRSAPARARLAPRQAPGGRRRRRTPPPDEEAGRLRKGPRCRSIVDSSWNARRPPAPPSRPPSPRRPSPPSAVHRAAKPRSPDAVGLLYDSTLCIGCKACVAGCKAANGMPPRSTRARPSGTRGCGTRPKDLSGKTLNVIKVYRDGDMEQKDRETNGFAFIKRQCLHCVDPSCVSCCPVSAMIKDPVTGIVSHDTDRCIGCRYCVFACPFQVPKYEYDDPFGQIQKCQLCQHRLAEGRAARLRRVARPAPPCSAGWRISGGRRTGGSR